MPNPPAPEGYVTPHNLIGVLRGEEPNIDPNLNPEDDGGKPMENVWLFDRREIALRAAKELVRPAPAPSPFYGLLRQRQMDFLSRLKLVDKFINADKGIEAVVLEGIADQHFVVLRHTKTGKPLDDEIRAFSNLESALNYAQKAARVYPKRLPAASLPYFCLVYVRTNWLPLAVLGVVVLFIWLNHYH